MSILPPPETGDIAGERGKAGERNVEGFLTIRNKDSEKYNNINI